MKFVSSAMRNRTGQINLWLRLRNVIRRNFAEMLLLCQGWVLANPRGNSKNYNVQLLQAGIEGTLAQMWCA